MAGDVINATVQYYHQGAAGGNNTNFLNTVPGSLTPAISGGTATSNLVKTNATNITTQLGGVNGFVNAVQPNGSNPPGNVPQAFLTVLFFDSLSRTDRSGKDLTLYLLPMAVWRSNKCWPR
jgi:hypothetical protein